MTEKLPKKRRVVDHPTPGRRDGGKKRRRNLYLTGKRLSVARSDQTKKTGKKQIYTLSVTPTRHLATDHVYKQNPDSPVDQECVAVEDFIHYFDEFSDMELSRAFDVTPRRIYTIKRQKYVSFAIADKWLTWLGLGHLLDDEIRVLELPAALQSMQDRWDATDNQADAPS